MKSIDVVCPVFQEEEVIESFHENLVEALSKLSASYQIRIVYVLDPSPDQTEAKLVELSKRDPRVEILVMSRRFGHQAALMAGMDHSTADAVIMLDSDLQHPPELVPQFVRRWEDGADIVQAIRNDGRDIHPAKRLTSRWFYLLFEKIGAVDLQVGAADFRLMSARIVRIFQTQMREHNPFLRGLVGWVGFRVDYISFVPAQRTKGHSKYRATTLFNFALNGICSFSKMPLRFCIVIGVVLALLSILAGVAQIVAYFAFTKTDLPGWASLVASVTFLGGLQLFFLGVIGEYIGLVFDEVKNRPRYLLARRLEQGQPRDIGDAERQMSVRRDNDGPRMVDDLGSMANKVGQ
jgi:glycosyltransferase involved in cell wall biosynthesis